MPGDIVSSKYPTTNALVGLFGNTTNVVNPSYPARSNLEYPLGNISDGALAATGVATAVAVPWDVGQTVSKITIYVGATAASTPTHGFAAIYSGIAVPALIAQSADTLTAAIAASASFTYTLSTAQQISAAQCPNGFIYVDVSGTGTAVQSALSVGTPTAVGYQLTTNGPLFFAATHGSALGGTAAATIASPSAKAVAPVVLVS